MPQNTGKVFAGGLIRKTPEEVAARKLAAEAKSQSKDDLKGALGGAGTVIGAIIGAYYGDSAAGAKIGGAVGGVTGTVAANESDAGEQLKGQLIDNAPLIGSLLSSEDPAMPKPKKKKKEGGGIFAETIGGE